MSFTPTPFIFDNRQHLPSAWKMAKGKLLTNRKIAEYQREGYYGDGLKLPPIEGAPCLKCKTRQNTRKYSYGYLELPGTYCIKHIKELREAHHIEQEEVKQQRLAKMDEFNPDKWIMI